MTKEQQRMILVGGAGLGGVVILAVLARKPKPGALIPLPGPPADWPDGGGGLISTFSGSGNPGIGDSNPPAPGNHHIQLIGPPGHYPAPLPALNPDPPTNTAEPPGPPWPTDLLNHLGAQAMTENYFYSPERNWT